MSIKTYSELIRLLTFEERLAYLCLNGIVGEETFGFERYLNQAFYKSKKWLTVRSKIIVRDNGCDLGIEGYDIFDKVYIHHLNPINTNDIKNQSAFLLNPEYLICTSKRKHDAIHYGINKLHKNTLKERYKNDMCPWLNQR